MKKNHALFLLGIYILGVFLRLYPRLSIDPHLLTFQGDIWYRLAMAQYVFDNHALPNPDLRYLAYGRVPMWYPPASPVFLALLSRLSGLDLPTVSSRLIPFIEAASPLSIFFLTRYMYDETAAYIATIALALTPTFVFWTGITDPQSLTLFLIPLYILLWLKHSKKPSIKNVGLLGGVLAVNFFFHLSYFVAALLLFFITIELALMEKKGFWLFRDLAAAILISQLITAPWWLPHNLYWWWIKSLVTSSGMYSAGWQIGDYGVVAAFLGIAPTSYVILKDRKWGVFLMLWILPLFIESQNEAILFALHRVDLTWTTLAKPLEGFRFFPYLAQPAAIAIGAFFSTLAKADVLKGFKQSRVQAFFVVLVGSLFLGGIWGPYNLEVKLQTSGLTTQEYKAALWFRRNSSVDSRIAADYYRAQMFTGVTGGKAIDGGMFPLRNVDFPYITVPATVQDDLYILYTAEDPKKAHSLAERYGITHVFYSKNMESYGNLLSSYRPASQYGIPIYLEKFNDAEYFRLAYEDGAGSIKIFEVV